MTKVELFNRQVERLRELNYHEAAQMPLDRFLSYIYPLKMLLPRIAEKEGFQPFVIVIPQRCIALQSQGSCLNIDYRTGSNNMGKISYAPGTVIPHIPYLATQVEPGKMLREIPPKLAVKKLNPFFRRRRWPLVIEEGYAQVAHFPKTMTRLTIDLAGSQIGQNAIPGIWIDVDGPWVIARPIDRSMPNRGVGSCESRLFVQNK